MDTGHRAEGIENWDLVVVYDPQDGRIIHTHQTVTWRGGEHPSQEEQERIAAGHAEAEAGVSSDEVAFLHTDPREVEQEGIWRVDPQTRSLVLERRI